MADRNQHEDESSNHSAPKEAKGTRPDSGQDDGLPQNAQPDEQQSTTSRPRGHTEEPDRTL